MIQEHVAALDQVGNDLFDLITLVETTNFKKSDERKQFIDRIAMIKQQYARLIDGITGLENKVSPLPAIRMYIKHPIVKKQFKGWIIKLHSKVEKIKNLTEQEQMVQLLKHQNHLLDITIKILNGDCFLTGIHRTTR